MSGPDLGDIHQLGVDWGLGVGPGNFANCGGHMRILAFLTDPEPVDAILRHLDLPATPPPPAPARGPPEPEPDLEFDQSRGG